MQTHYFLVYKPYGYTTQFSTNADNPLTLASLYPFPKAVYPVGRLDKDSEGLLLLTNDKSLNNKLLNPNFAHKRTYHVQVENIPTNTALQALQNGVLIRAKKKTYQTKPAKITLLNPAPIVPERSVPIRFRKNIPTAWLSMTLTEGKNRQVRRMTAKVGHPTLRLIRVSIEQLTLGTLQVGEVKKLSKKMVYESLFTR